MNNFKIEKRKITLREYQELRSTTDWPPLEDEQLEKALDHDLFSVCVLEKDKTVGMGRVIGDAAIYFYIQDVIVHPDYRGKGIGKLLMDTIESYLKKEAGDNAFIGLMAAEGVKDFYRQYGFSERPLNRPGMFKMINKE